MFPIVHECEQVGLIPDVLYIKRAHEGSIMRTKKPGNLRDWVKAHEMFALSIREAYPDLSPKANRSLEKIRISAWLSWYELSVELGSEEAFKSVEHFRELAIQHRRDLVLPADLRKLLTLCLLRIAPEFALLALREWKRKKDIDIQK